MIDFEYINNNPSKSRVIFSLSFNINKDKRFSVRTKSIIKNYKGHNKAIYGIEKIKVDGNKEYIITYDENEIKLWK